MRLKGHHMSIDNIPYLMISQDIPVHIALGVMREVKVFVCINLLDHRAVGISVDRRESLDAMSDQYEELNSDTDEPDVGSYDI